MCKLAQLAIFFPRCQGLSCEWGAGVLYLVLSLSLSHSGHWKFNMAPHGKEISEDRKTLLVYQHKDGVGYKKIAKTLKPCPGVRSSYVANSVSWIWLLTISLDLGLFGSSKLKPAREQAYFM